VTSLNTHLISISASSTFPSMACEDENYSLDQLFQTCDTDGNGRIVPKEFREMCKKFDISESDANAIFKDLDHDGDGEIDFNEFSHGFRDFLMPGSRRGSLQVNSVESSQALKQLQEMEKRHASAKPAWRHFVHSVGPTNVQSFLNNWYKKISLIRKKTL